MGKLYTRVSGTRPREVNRKVPIDACKTSLFLSRRSERGLLMTFEFDAERYQRASAHQQEWGDRLIAELGLVGEERILDVGCGDGSLTRKLATNVSRGRVLGVDSSARMVEAARRYEDLNLHFSQMDILDAPFEGEFDVVFSNATLHWVKNHSRLLEILHRSLTPGGVIRLNFAGQGNCSHFIGVVQELMAGPTYQTAFSTFEWPWYMPTVEEYDQLARKSPFSEIRVWGEVADRPFLTLEAMVGWIDQPSLVPFRMQLERENLGSEGFRQAVISRMIEVTKQTDGSYWESFRRINVLGRKRR